MAKTVPPGESLAQVCPWQNGWCVGFFRPMLSGANAIHCSRIFPAAGAALDQAIFIKAIRNGDPASIVQSDESPYDPIPTLISSFAPAFGAA
jgi:hypothetical protein